MDDLIATADRQLASRAYDAAIDTYRTALGEPGAMEAHVEQLLDAACRIRDEARGMVRPAEPIAPPEPLPEIPAPPAEARTESKPEPEPAPRVEIDNSPIEPPAFHLIEDDPSMLERPRRDRYVEYNVRSILDPTPPPELLDPKGTAARLLIAMVIAIAVVLVAYYAR